MAVVDFTSSAGRVVRTPPRARDARPGAALAAGLVALAGALGMYAFNWLGAPEAALLAGVPVALLGAGAAAYAARPLPAQGRPGRGTALAALACVAVVTLAVAVPVAVALVLLAVFFAVG